MIRKTIRYFLVLVTIFVLAVGVYQLVASMAETKEKSYQHAPKESPGSVPVGGMLGAKKGGKSSLEERLGR